MTMPVWTSSIGKVTFSLDTNIIHRAREKLLSPKCSDPVCVCVCA